jgi:hypothetical protein
MSEQNPVSDLIYQTRIKAIKEVIALLTYQIEGYNRTIRSLKPDHYNYSYRVKLHAERGALLGFRFQLEDMVKQDETKGHNQN